MKKISKKIGLCGCGYWGKNVARVLNEMGSLAVICDLDQTLISSHVDKYPGVKLTTEFENLLRDPSVDALVIATPPKTHHALVKQALMNHKDVFVEKPLALQVSHGEELVALAKKMERVLMVGHILNYHPAIVKLKELIRENVLGKIHYMYSNRLNIGRIKHEENILWSFAPHDISLFLSIVGERPTRVVSLGGIYLPHAVEDITLTFFEFPGGTRGHIFVSWLNPYKEHKFVVIGEKKMAVFDDASSDHKLVLYQHKINWSMDQVPAIEKANGEVVEISGREPLQKELEHFLECLQTRRAPLTNGEEGLRVLQILERAENSLKKGGDHE